MVLAEACPAPMMSAAAVNEVKIALQPNLIEPSNSNEDESRECDAGGLAILRPNVTQRTNTLAVTRNFWGCIELLFSDPLTILEQPWMEIGVIDD